MKYVEAAEGASLLLLHFRAAEQGRQLPVLMIGGLSTVPDNFQPLIRDLTRDFDVYYLETREKASSKLLKMGPFTMETFGKDIAAVVQGLGLTDGGYILMGYSFGAAVIVEAARFLPVRPALYLLLSPTPVFRYPWFALVLMRLTLHVNARIKPLAKWWLARRYVNRKEDPEMLQITQRVVDSADPPKLKRTILSIAKYAVWDRLPALRGPVLLVATSKDGIHVQGDITRMAEAIPDCTYLDLENNRRSHSAEMAELLRAHLNKMHGEASLDLFS